MSCNCKTTSHLCEPCAFCTPPGVTCLTTCEPPDPCTSEKVDLCCVLYSGEDHECSGITNGEPLCDILIQVLETIFPPEYCCALTGTISLVTTTTTVVPTTTTTSSTSTTTSTTSTTSTTTTSTTTTTTTVAPFEIVTNTALGDICYVQPGSLQGKLQITNFDITLAPGYSVIGLESITLTVPSATSPNFKSYLFLPFESLPYSTGLYLTIPTNITSALKHPYPGTIDFRTIITDGPNEYLVTSTLNVSGWIDLFSDSDCQSNHQITPFVFTTAIELYN